MFTDFVNTIKGEKKKELEAKGVKPEEIEKKIVEKNCEIEHEAAKRMTSELKSENIIITPKKGDCSFGEGSKNKAELDKKFSEIVSKV